jgi:Bacterial transcriptional activator domain
MHVPRLAPSTIRRPRVEDWLGRFSSAPVRLLIAPPGFGKTTALVSYLRHSPARGIFCNLMSGTTAAVVRGAISRALEIPGGCASRDDLIGALSTAAPLELALDCEGIPDASGVSEILHIINEAPEGVSLIVATRSRAAFDAGRLVTRGLAALCDVERLAFDVGEVAHLARACGITFAIGDIPRLIERTDGWPQVVSGAIRAAAEDGCALGACYDNWRKRRGHLFNEFITTALSDAAQSDATYVRKLMHGHRFDDQHESLQQLEREGLFVIHCDNEYRPLRPVSRIETHHFAEPRAVSVTPLKVQMLGWFRADIDGREIKWIRRRDQQIFKYLALKPNGVVTRAELGEVFWPGGEKQLVQQCLRTACSNIRKAIAHVVGFNLVDAYFMVNGEVGIDSANVSVDVKTFVGFANDGDNEFEHGDRGIARQYYARANELYRGDLLIGDRQEPWVAEQAALLEARRNNILERLAQIKPRAVVQRVYTTRARLAAG